jgi:hypothetical protein
MSRKVFTAGEVLAAADVNSFLMDQTVMSFAGTAARGSAISSPVEGMTTFLEDSNILSIYEGGAWRNSLSTTGGVLQVVSQTYATQTATTSATYVYAGVQATITPKSTASRILVLVSGTYGIVGSGVSGDIAIFANGQSGSEITSLKHRVYSEGATELFLAFALSNLHSPATASAYTYSLMFRRGAAGGTFRVQQGDAPTTIALIEVA